MVKDFALSKRAQSVAAAAVMLMASILPAVLLIGRAEAAQVTNRSIRVTSSVASASSVTYNVSFRPATSTGTGADDILGIVVEFCQNSPLIGASCTTTNGISNTPTSSSISVAHTGATGTPVSFTVDGASTSNGRLILTNGSGLDVITPANPITFSFTATNPSAVGTYYARILTYNSVAGAQAYTSATPGTHLDDGGVALSTARQLTINARVQEQLEFCVSAIDGTIDTNGEAPANCAAAAFNGTNQTVDIGVVDSGAASISPVAATSGGNDRNGAVMIRTNAVNGATISYFAQQETSSGALKVVGAACGTNGYGSGTTTDQCFNSAGGTEQDFSVAGEGFGMTASDVLEPTGSTTTNLTRDTDYDGNGTAAGGWAWVASGANDPAETLASSTTVMDYEMLVLRFAARAAATTPTGSYTVTSTYIATATY